MNKINWQQIAYLWNGALIGVTVGMVVSLFRWLIEGTLMFMTQLYQLAHHDHWWLVLIVGLNLLIGGIVGWLIHTTPNIKGSGIPQVEGQLAQRLDYPFWPVLWKKFGGGVLAIGSGLFLGREGPSIQLGSTTAQGIAKCQGLTGQPRRIAIAAGAAAGLAAAFNAPIASALFVLEEIYHEFPMKVWPTTLGAAIIANLVSTEWFGQTPVLHMQHLQPFPLNQYWVLLLLGLLLGGLGIVYQRVTLNASLCYRWCQWFPKQFWGVVPLLLVVPIGYYYPLTLGGGNHLILATAARLPSVQLLGGYLLLRFVFATLSYGSGVPGGIFLPILTLGALLGAFYGQILVSMHLLSGTLVINLIVIAMAAFFAGITKSPFTAILLITEMVGSVTHFMSLAIVSLLAYAVVDLFKGRPIYSQMLANLLRTSH